MNRAVFDIETLAFPFESFDPEQQEYIVKFAKNDEEIDDAKLRMNLSPLTARLIAIGLYNPDTKRGKVLYQADKHEKTYSENDLIEYVATDEAGILKTFWEDIARYNQFITFNGRGFDSPFLMLRSAMLRIKPTRNLIPSRYDSKVHCDLLDQLTFYGSFRKYNLDFYCKALGIKSPKSDGITGLDLGKLFEEKRYRDIADYCIGDVIATAELYRIWEEYINI
jgi:3'-5' exonuclease